MLAAARRAIASRAAPQITIPGSQKSPTQARLSPSQSQRPTDPASPIARQDSRGSSLCHANSASSRSTSWLTLSYTHDASFTSYHGRIPSGLSSTATPHGCIIAQTVQVQPRNTKSAPSAISVLFSAAADCAQGGTLSNPSHFGPTISAHGGSRAKDSVPRIPNR